MSLERNNNKKTEANLKIKRRTGHKVHKILDSFLANEPVNG